MRNGILLLMLMLPGAPALASPMSLQCQFNGRAKEGCFRKYSCAVSAVLRPQENESEEDLLSLKSSEWVSVKCTDGFQLFTKQSKEISLATDGENFTFGFNLSDSSGMTQGSLGWDVGPVRPSEIPPGKFPASFAFSPVTPHSYVLAGDCVLADMPVLEDSAVFQCGFTRETGAFHTKEACSLMGMVSNHAIEQVFLAQCTNGFSATSTLASGLKLQHPTPGSTDWHLGTNLVDSRGTSVANFDWNVGPMEPTGSIQSGIFEADFGIGAHSFNQPSFLGECNISSSTGA